MQALNGPVPANGYVDESSLRIDAYCAAISDALAKGQIKPYEQALENGNGHYYRQSWLSELKAFAKGNLAGDAKQVNNLVACYLFVVSVADDKDHEKKELLFKECLKHLTAEQKETFAYQLCDGFTPVMRLALLRYCPKDIWEEMFQRLFRYGSFCSFEESLAAVVQEVEKSAWTPLEKKNFLELLFERLPKEKGDELYYSFVLKMPEAALEKVMSLCSETLVARFSALTASVREFGEKTLAEVEQAPRAVRLPYREKSHQRHYFLSWFFTHQRNHPACDLIACDFKEKDWKWLHAEMKRPQEAKLCTYAMKWLIMFTKRISDNSLHREETMRYHDPHCWLFFNYITAFIDKEKGFSEISDESYLIFAASLGANILFQYFDAFNGEFRSKIMKQILATHSEKIVEWMKLIMLRNDELRKCASEELSKLFSLVAANGGVEEILHKVYHPEQSALLKLTVFAAVPEEARAIIVRILLTDRKAALCCLSEWIGLCEHGKAFVRPFVRDALTENLYKVLMAVDPNVCLELKNILVDAFKDSREALEFIDLLLPLGLDLNDPISRSNEALKKLKRHFETPNIPHEDRRHFVREISDDLRRDLSRQAFIDMLFQALTPQSWPLVFLYFDNDICSGFYMEYFEEKTNGGTFKKTNKHAEAKMSVKKHENRFQEVADQKVEALQQASIEAVPGAAQDAVLWKMMAVIDNVGSKGAPVREGAFADEHRWISIAAQTLNNMHNNPRLQHGGEDSMVAWAMQHFYQAACETNTIHKIMQRFCELCEPANFIPTINRLGQAAFFHNPEDLLGLVADSLEEANLDRPRFIAQCLLAEQRRGNRGFGGVDLERNFWKEPFLKTEQARAQVARCLIDEMHEPFLHLFSGHKRQHVAMIKSLYITDEAYCLELFTKSLVQLVQSNRPDGEAFRLFHDVCFAYSEAGIDVIKLLLQEDFQQLRPVVAKWHSEAMVQVCLNETVIAWRLLRIFAPKLFYPTVLQRIRAEITSERFVNFFSFNQFLELFHQLECLESLKTRMFEDQELTSAIKEKIQKHINEAFHSYHAHFIPIVKRLVPDWCVRLASWAKVKIKEEKERSLSYGAKPHYFDLKELYKSLKKLNLLDEFWQEMLKESSEELQKELERIKKLSEKS